MYKKITNLNSKDIILHKIPKYRVQFRHCICLFCIAAILIVFVYCLNPSNQLVKIYLKPISTTIEQQNKLLKIETKKTIINKTKFNQSMFDKINKRIWESFKNEQKQNWTNLECNRFVTGDENYIKENAKNKLKYYDPNDEQLLLMDCNSIKLRNYFIEKPISDIEKKFPLAYARNVYTDYRFLEAELATNYHPQNWYCFAIDSKANELFHKRINALASCFKNVIIPKKEFSVDSAGHNMGSAFMSCFNELTKKEKHWEYVFTLQNHDTQIKTNEEAVQIFKWLNGANSIEFEFRHVGPQQMIKEMHQQYNWTFTSLNLFKNEKMNNRFDEKGNPLQLKLTKGLVETALSRPFTDFIVKELDLTKMLAQLDSRNYGADELFFQTIGSSDHLNAPNGFTHKCVEQKIDVPYIIRYSVWDYGAGRWENVGKCYSGHTRHSICIIGIEDLAQTVTKVKHLFVNKMMPSIDFGAIYCWHEEMRKRTLLDSGLHRLNPNLYQNWPQTRFHQEWLRTNGNVDLQKFNCSQPIIPN